MAIAVEAAAEGRQILWGAPTKDQCRVSWKETKKAAGNVAKFNQGTMIAEFPGGGSIVYRSLDDPDNARGYTADGIVMDECADIHPDAWHEVLRPMLIDTGGWAWLIGTPHGRNWYFQEHERARHRADSMSWQVPTLGCALTETDLARRPHPLENPHIPFTELAQMAATMPRRTFEQEILAEFIDDGGGVFRKVRAAATATRQLAPIAQHTYVAGLDFGKHHDWTVLTTLDAATREVVAIDRFNQIDYALQTGRVKAAHDRFHYETIVAERNSMGEPVIEQMLRDGLPIQPFQTTAASKMLIIDALALAFEQGTLRILDDETLIGELQAFEAARLPGGMLRYGAPAGQHDDCVISLALGYHAVDTRHVPGIWLLGSDEPTAEEDW